MGEKKYSASNIQVLEGLEAVRKRPGMYIGSVSENGLHHLVWEIVDNSIDEAMAGFAKNITVKHNSDESIEVEDDGRGIPIEIHPKTGVSSVETVLTVLHAGGKFDSNAYKVSGGLHGVGASVVNALSKKLEIWVEKDGKKYYQVYSNGGTPETELKMIGETNKTGTKIKFYPDPSIFEVTNFDFLTINSRMRQLAFLNKGLKIIVEDEATSKKHEYVFKEGLLEYVRDLNKNKELLTNDVIYTDAQVNTKDANNEEFITEVEIAIQYNNSYSSNISSFVNNISTTEGGTHEHGFYDAIVRVLNTYAIENKKFKSEIEKITKEDIKEGLVAIISVRHPHPLFEGQTKTKLGNTDARKSVNIAFSNVFERYLNENPKQAEIIINKVLSAQRARFAAQKARDEIRKHDEFDIASLPGKLSDCSSSKAEECELYIVEGDSAGGSAKLGRDRRIQAILPLRGKILNVEKSRVDKVFENKEILSLITALKTGVNEDLEIEKLRYHKVIIMTDADVDGSHIRILLLTFFYRYLRPLVEQGFIYIAQPPLYKIQLGKNTKYCYLEKEKETYLKSLKDDSKPIIQRYKGLGEMDATQLWETTMNPETRKMMRIEVVDAQEANEVFSALMGEDVTPRKEFISENAKYAQNIDT